MAWLSVRAAVAQKRRKQWFLTPFSPNASGLIEHETRFAYDGNQIVLQFDEDCSGPTQMTNANLSHRYLWQPNAVDQLLADEQVTSPNATGSVVYPLTDQEGREIHNLAVATLNSSTGLMNTTVVNHIVYNAFGKVVSSVNPVTNAAPTVKCLFGYTRKSDGYRYGFAEQFESLV